jgi:hypothetical protein
MFTPNLTLGPIGRTREVTVALDDSFRVSLTRASSLTFQAKQRKCSFVRQAMLVARSE